jgi:hypothetical protein
MLSGVLLLCTAYRRHAAAVPANQNRAGNHRPQRPLRPPWTVTHPVSRYELFADTRTTQTLV